MLSLSFFLPPVERVWYLPHLMIWSRFLVAIGAVVEATIHLQRHIFCDSVVHDRGYERHLIFCCSLLFYYRGYDEFLPKSFFIQRILFFDFVIFFLGKIVKSTYDFLFVTTVLKRKSLRPQLPPLYRDWETDRKSTRLNSSHITRSRMPSSA